MSYLDSYQKRGISFQRHKLFYTTGISNKYEPLTAILDDVAILSRYRGKRYQLLLWNYIALHFCSKTKFLLASIHPDNIASLKNAFYFDMTITSQRKMYNNALRYILLKEL